MRPVGRKLRILLACEYSGVFREAFTALGHDAWSVDLDPSPEDSPRHLQMDIKSFLSVNAARFDLVVAFPPCTHLARSGAKHWPEKRADGRQQEAADFFMYFVHLHKTQPQRFPRVAIENSVGCMSTKYRKPDCVVHPFHFGEPFSKQTCFWVHGDLPAPVPTVEPPYDKGEFYIVPKSGKKVPAWYNLPQTKDRGKKWSRAFPGMAAALAQQWSDHIIKGAGN